MWCFLGLGPFSVWLCSEWQQLSFVCLRTRNYWDWWEVFAKWVFFVSSFVCQFAKDHKEEDEAERGPSLIVNPLTPLGFLLLSFDSDLPLGFVCVCKIEEIVGRMKTSQNGKHLHYTFLFM
jgi:hypothetical protein